MSWRFLQLTLAAVLVGGGLSCRPPEPEKVEASSEVKDADATSTSADVPQNMVSELGMFGSDEPLLRQDQPTRGVLSFEVKDKNETFAMGEHWEQYNFPFTAARWGRYMVQIGYQLKSSSLGVQLKLGDKRLKKSLSYTGDHEALVTLGTIDLQDGEQFMALYTPSAVGWNTFFLKEIRLVPVPYLMEMSENASNHLILPAHAATPWGEVLRYEPHPDKNCLGYWTAVEDFAEWEFELRQPGKYQVVVHQGCGDVGGSDVEVSVGDQQLQFKVESTGGFQKWKALEIGVLDLKDGGRQRLSIRPKNKNGAAIMDVQKVELIPIS